MEGFAVAEARVLTGLVVGYRLGSNTQYENQVLIRIDGVTRDKEAARYIGWRVIYRDSKGNTYRGRIIRTHGGKGVLIAVFKPNLPGQARGGTVYIYPKGVELVFEKQ
jgi:large subunit ribosomal protein L35Ae